MEKSLNENTIGTPEVFLALEINSEGMFQYVWSIYNADKLDYLALYENKSLPNKDYIKGSKTNGATMGFKVTKIAAKQQVELRYLSYNRQTKAYQCRYMTSAFPDIVFSTSRNDLQLTLSDGKIKVNYNSPFVENYDWIGLYPKDADPDDYNGYVKYEWVNMKKESVLFDLRYFEIGLTARYYCESGGRYSGIWNKEYETPPIEMIKAFYDKTTIRTLIDNQGYNNLKQQFPQLNRSSTYITGGQTMHYNCIAYSLGFTDRWINPPERKTDFIGLYNTFGYIECDKRSLEKCIDLYMMRNQNGELVGTHGAKYNSNDSTWESKLGMGYRIEHAREDLAGTGSIYGNIEVTLKSNYVTRGMLRKSLSHTQKKTVCELAENIPQDQMILLEKAFETWKKTWWSGKYLYSSNTRDFANGKEYDSLMKMKNIETFIMMKLCEEDNFPALYALQSHNLVISQQFLDEQSKVVMTVDAYLDRIK